MKSMHFLNIIFFLLSIRKYFLYIYFPAEISEFSFNPRGKIGWPPGHLDKVCMFYDTKTINLITFKKRMLTYSLNIYNVLDFNTLSN